MSAPFARASEGLLWSAAGCVSCWPNRGSCQPIGVDPAVIQACTLQGSPARKARGATRGSADLAPDRRWVDHRLKGLDKCSIPRSRTARSVAVMSFWTRRIGSASGSTAARASRSVRCETFSRGSLSVRRKEKPRQVRGRMASTNDRSRAPWATFQVGRGCSKARFRSVFGVSTHPSRPQAERIKRVLRSHCCRHLVSRGVFAQPCHCNLRRAGRWGGGYGQEYCPVRHAFLAWYPGDRDSPRSRDYPASGVSRGSASAPGGRRHAPARCRARTAGDDGLPSDAFIELVLRCRLRMGVEATRPGIGQVP